MKKRAGGLPIVTKSSRFRGGKADSFDTRPTSFGSTGNKAVAPCGQWSVAEAVEVAKVLWCDGAATVVAWSALSAHCEGDTREYRFWFEVFKHLQAGSSNSELEGMTEGAHQHSLH
ncbi:hypothetical protein EH240_11000 [Mesorhizobium tamadayense]|uniref:Uncharacterized protein n=1 Tax=Mesorhizobium tamadayense TaxID=425306 RepID=A0A3P3FWW1_9HYPH|nr:hypothetical protein [Mesorhizobium tamadayense]RRI03091.1 hypothetical protein EH240_11000 [Mesorhizobium tamadayense]